VVLGRTSDTLHKTYTISLLSLFYSRFSFIYIYSTCDFLKFVLVFSNTAILVTVIMHFWLILQIIMFNFGVCGCINCKLLNLLQYFSSIFGCMFD